MSDNIGYKIVQRNESGTLSSCVVRWAAYQLYKPGEFVSAPEWLAKDGYHLTYFVTEDGVLNFLLSNKYSFEYKAIEVWSCVAEGIVAKLPPRLEIDYLQCGIKEPDVRTYGFAQREYVPWPTDTAMAERIKLVTNISYMFFGGWQRGDVGNRMRLLSKRERFDLAQRGWR